MGFALCRLFRQEYLMDHLLGSLERPQVSTYHLILNFVDAGTFTDLF